MSESIVQCHLCPKECLIAPNQSGECRVRVNMGGKLRSVTYGHPCAVHRDPVEKKPLFHFLPGTEILSLATVGCNLHCKFCQNWEISQRNPEDIEAYALSPEELLRLAVEHRCPSIAYTYTEPIVFYEYVLKTSEVCRAHDIRNVIVTAGYAMPTPWRALCRAVDAANVDLKAFSDDFYREMCDGSLQPILDNLVIAQEEGIHLEITNLLIPTLNDSPEQVKQLCGWVTEHLGPLVPIHFSAFHPQHKLRHLPPTPPETLVMAKEIAHEIGLKFVYVGNIQIPGGENTICPSCGKVLIERQRYQIVANHLVNGVCPSCQTSIPGVWG